MNAIVSHRPPIILVVDDEERNVQLLEGLLHDKGYATIAARSGREALVLAAEKAPDLIILDAMMPDIDGFATVARLKADPGTRPVPVIMITALSDRESKLRALNAGAEEFLTKPVDIADLTARVRNMLRLKEYGDFLLNHNRILEERVKERTVQVEEAHRDTILTLARAAEYRDEETGYHVRRISYYCRLMASEMGMPSDFITAIYLSSPMHDVGKIGIPDQILLKPGELTSAESAIMKTHSALGAGILAAGRSPYTLMGVEIALNHHEHWDGSGYPNGCKGADIPLPARIMQICDVYDALRSRRPYKPPIAHARSVKIISEGDGRTHPGHFDPAVLACFLKHATRLGAIYDQYADAIDP
jgi:putative two-component system response regulator